MALSSDLMIGIPLTVVGLFLVFQGRLYLKYAFFPDKSKPMLYSAMHILLLKTALGVGLMILPVGAIMLCHQFYVPSNESARRLTVTKSHNH